MAGMQVLNETQSKAARSALDVPLLVLAGPGSGKTRTLIERLVHIREQGVAPEHVLAITFTNKAAEEIRERLRLRMEESADTLEWLFGDGCVVAAGTAVSTFHLLCWRMLKTFGDHLGRKSSSLSIYGPHQQFSCVRKCLVNDRKARGGKEATPTRQEVDAMVKLFAALKCRGETPTAGTVEDRCFRKYNESLRRANAVDFGGMILEATRLIREVPSVRAKLQAAFTHLLVDEFQDVSRAQLLFVDALLGGRTAGRDAGTRASLTAVGDDDQRIYSFREGKLRKKNFCVISLFLQLYPNAERVTLTRNYRSTKTILAAGARLISKNTSRLEKTLFTNNPVGCSIRVASTKHPRAEAQAILLQLDEWLQAGKKPGQIAVLYRNGRANFTLNHLKAALDKMNVQYEEAGASSDDGAKEVLDVLAVLQLLVNRDDSAACARALAMGAPASFLKGGLEVIQVDAASKDIPLLASLESMFSGSRACSALHALSPDDRRVCKTLLRTIRAAEDIAARPPASLGALIDVVMERMHVLPSTRRRKYRAAITRARHQVALGRGDLDSGVSWNVEEVIAKFDGALDALRSTARTWDAQHEGREAQGMERVAEFLASTSLMDKLIHESTESLSATVTLSTIHKAKGLEWHCVVLACMEEGVLPSTVSENDSKHVDREEERRLCHVAMSRARESLCITHSGPPSSFIEEIEQWCSKYDTSAAAGHKHRSIARIAKALNKKNKTHAELANTFASMSQDIGGDDQDDIKAAFARVVPWDSVMPDEIDEEVLRELPPEVRTEINTQLAQMFAKDERMKKGTKKKQSKENIATFFGSTGERGAPHGERGGPLLASKDTVTDNTWCHPVYGSLDSEALGALPLSIRAEVLLHSRHARQGGRSIATTRSTVAGGGHAKGRGRGPGGGGGGGGRKMLDSYFLPGSSTRFMAPRPPPRDIDPSVLREIPPELLRELGVLGGPQEELPPSSRATRPPVGCDGSARACASSLDGPTDRTVPPPLRTQAGDERDGGDAGALAGMELLERHYDAEVLRHLPAELRSELVDELRREGEEGEPARKKVRREREGGEDRGLRGAPR